MTTWTVRVGFMDVRFDGILARLGVKGYKALRRDRREQLNCAGEPDGAPIPQKAKAGLLDRVDLVLKLIDQVESARDAVLNKDAPADEAEWMIGSLTDLRSIGPHVATLLVREALVRQFRNSTRARRIRRAWQDAVLKRRQ